MKKYISIVAVALLLASCTKEINIDLNSSNPLLVIEGYISDEHGNYTVKLSKTVNFSDANVYPPVSGALVIISDNTGVVDTLSEIASGLYQTHSIVGTQGRTYTLKVTAEGEQYTAVSTMPQKVNLDSLRFTPVSVPNTSGNVFAVVPVYIDPLELGNSYRFVLTINNKLDASYYLQTDNIENGTENQSSLFSFGTEIKSGDTVRLEMLCIDANTYLYYNSLSELLNFNPIFSSTPSNPPNNITGNKALGFFSAYTTQTKIKVVD